MASVSVRIRNINAWRRAMRKAPQLVAERARSAIEAGIQELDKEMIDPNYRFVLPRAQRTGHMALRKEQGVSPTGLSGFIGHQVRYAPFVYEYHKRRGNDFMERFIRNTEDRIQGHFDDALDLAMQDIANRV